MLEDCLGGTGVLLFDASAQLIQLADARRNLIVLLPCLLKFGLRCLKFNAEFCNHLVTGCFLGSLQLGHQGVAGLRGLLAGNACGGHDGIQFLDLLIINERRTCIGLSRGGMFFRTTDHAWLAIF